MLEQDAREVTGGSTLSSDTKSGSDCSHLYVQVVVVSLRQLDEHGEQREDGSGAEESALRPDHCHAEQSQDHRQQPVEPALQETLPVPLCRTTHTLPPGTSNAAAAARVGRRVGTQTHLLSACRRICWTSRTAQTTGSCGQTGGLNWSHSWLHPPGGWPPAAGSATEPGSCYVSELRRWPAHRREHVV